VTFHKKEFVMSLSSAAVNRLRELSRKVFIRNLRANTSRADYPPRLHARAALPLMEQLEPRLMLSATFSDQQVITTAADLGSSVFAADLDGDGDMDILGASEGDDKIAWYENTDGAGTFGGQQVISTGATNTQSVFAADLDGDGDMDVISGSENKIAWYENTDGAGTFGAQQVISTALGYTMSVFAADLDGDGDMDVLSASFSDDKTAWYENTDGAGTFGAQQVISTDGDGAHSVYAADLDGDGDNDVLATSMFDDTVAWYENTDGAGTFGGEQVISTDADGANSAVAADVDGDGDLDVLSASISDHKIAWYENTDGAGTFGGEQVITTLANGAHALFAADLDGDGDIDALSAGRHDDEVAWYENIDGAGTFGAQQILDDAPTMYEPWSVFAADLNGDGKTDILSTSRINDTVVWYENTTLFSNPQIITDSASAVQSVFAADVDGDGDIDALSAAYSDNAIGWHENTDGAGTFSARQVISGGVSGAQDVFAADIDGDGDMDALSAGHSDGTVAWYANTDGAGTFGGQQLITTLATGAESVFATDLDGDGDIDVLSASMSGDTIAWYENTDGAGTFGARQVISTSATNARTVYAADLDGDGDMDVLAAAGFNDKIVWYENTDGAGTFGGQQYITASADNAWGVSAADIDGDGDMDVLTASFGDDTIAWYENTDGAGAFGGEQVITTDADGATSVTAADIDGDGDMDVLSASTRDNTVAWYENTDGVGTFGPQQPITTSASTALVVVAADIDGDGDPDAVSASSGNDTVAWYKNDLPPVPTTPNLIVSATTPTELTASVGASVTIDISTKNDDLGDVASAFETQLFLSTDNTVTAGDTQVAAPAGNFSALAAGVSTLRTFTFNAPTTPGTYYLKALADGGEAITESAEDDNWGDLVTLVVSADTDLFGRAHAQDLGEVGNAAQVVKGAIGKTATSEDYNDWFTFTVTGRRKITATLTGLKKNANIQLTDADGVVLKTSAKKGTANEKLTFAVTDLGDGGTTTFYLRIYTTSTKKTPYSLSVKATDDTEKNGWANAASLGTPGSKAVKVEDKIGAVDMNDWYKIKVKGTKKVTLRLDRMDAGTETELRLHADPDAVPLSTTTLNAVDTSTQAQIVKVLTAGTYYVHLFSQDTTVSPYRLRVSCAGDADFAKLSKAKDTGRLAAVVKTYAGTLGEADRSDWYKFTTTKNGRAITLALKDVGGNFDLAFYNAKGKLLATSAEDGDTDEAIVRTRNAGVYYARVFVRGDSHLDSVLGYTLEMSAPTPAPP
jgi:hypothetical protein